MINIISEFINSVNNNCLILEMVLGINSVTIYLLIIIIYDVEINYRDIRGKLEWLKHCEKSNAVEIYLMPRFSDTVSCKTRARCASWAVGKLFYYSFEMCHLTPIWPCVYSYHYKLSSMSLIQFSKCTWRDLASSGHWGYVNPCSCIMMSARSLNSDEHASGGFCG